VSCVFCGIIAGTEPAHVILVPQHGPYDLTSARFAKIVDGKIVFTLDHIPVAGRHVLDEHARLLSE
jgi:hypothetical protein